MNKATVMVLSTMRMEISLGVVVGQLNKMKFAKQSGAILLVRTRPNSPI